MMLPQLGMLGGVPAPRKERIASTIIADAATKVPCTRSGGNVLGRMWRHRMRKKPVPLAKAASTKGSSRKVSTTPRTRRVTRGTSATVIAKITFSMLARVSAINAIAISTAGIDISPSMIRITIASVQRLKPVTRPIRSPNPLASSATLIPTVSDTRAP
jgi:hypothetical protein